MIDFDGNKVWVNHPHCLARLCSISGEVVENERLVTVAQESFEAWCARVRKHLGIYVPEYTKPNWAKGNKNGNAP